jgi:hypothetical protein
LFDVGRGDYVLGVNRNAQGKRRMTGGNLSVIPAAGLAFDFYYGRLDFFDQTGQPLFERAGLTKTGKRKKQKQKNKSKTLHTVSFHRFFSPPPFKANLGIPQVYTLWTSESSSDEGKTRFRLG